MYAVKIRLTFLLYPRRTRVHVYMCMYLFTTTNTTTAFAAGGQGAVGERSDGGEYTPHVRMNYPCLGGVWRQNVSTLLRPIVPPSRPSPSWLPYR